MKFYLKKYAEDGSVFHNIEVLKLQPFDELGNIIEIVDKFGGKEKYLEEIKIYKASYIELVDEFR